MALSPVFSLSCILLSLPPVWGLLIAATHRSLFIAATRSVALECGYFYINMVVTVE